MDGTLVPIPAWVGDFLIFKNYLCKLPIGNKLQLGKMSIPMNVVCFSKQQPVSLACCFDKICLSVQLLIQLKNVMNEFLF